MLRRCADAEMIVGMMSPCALSNSICRSAAARTIDGNRQPTTAALVVQCCF
jgi:hypothetical protein